MYFRLLIDTLTSMSTEVGARDEIVHKLFVNLIFYVPLYLYLFGAGCLLQPASFAVSFTAHKVFPAVVTKPLLRLNLKSHCLLNWCQ